MLRVPHSALALLTLALLPQLARSQALPSLPEPVPVLALALAPDRAIWAGTYGAGIYVLRPGAGAWEHIVHSSDTATHSISWDFVHAFGFGSQGEVWYGTVGNGWGLSLDNGKTWTNWELKQLGPEWQYVAPNGIAIRGDTAYVATADGIKLSFDRGATWAEVTDSMGATTASHVWGRIANQYVNAIAAGPDGSLWIAHLCGLARSLDGGRTWSEYATPERGRALLVQADGSVWVGTEQGIYRFDPVRRMRAGRVKTAAVQGLARSAGGDVYAATADGMYRADGNSLNACDAAPFASALLPLSGMAYVVGRATGVASCRFDQGVALVGIGYQQRPDTVTVGLKHTWFRRPIAPTDQPYIDQTYRYGSTMGGNFQQHQGVEFNNPDGTPVLAIGAGVVVFAGPAEQGSNTVVIRHDRTLKRSDGTRVLFSTYYHNSALLVAVGQRVKEGDAIARVGNTGRATNDHLHLEVHASPYDSVSLIVDPNERYPRYTVNPELWIAPLPGTGIVAGQVWDADGRPVAQARVYGLRKAEPQETPFAYAETYGEHNHPDPAYQEHFAVSDVPPGDYTLTVDVGDRPITHRVRVDAGAVTWVEFRPDAH
jgi:murein DD-endopeptidase MepM/ murein hydrolase activator NlpD